MKITKLFGLLTLVCLLIVNSMLVIANSERVWYQGETWNDATGYANLTNQNSAGFEPGKIGNAFKFNSASSQYANSSSTLTLIDNYNKDYLLVQWINISNLPGVNGFWSGFGNNSGTNGTTYGLSNAIPVVLRAQTPSAGNNTYIINWTTETGKFRLVAFYYNASDNSIDLYYGNDTVLKYYSKALNAGGKVNFINNSQKIILGARLDISNYGDVAIDDLRLITNLTNLDINQTVNFIWNNGAGTNQSISQMTPSGSIPTISFTTPDNNSIFYLQNESMIINATITNGSFNISLNIYNSTGSIIYTNNSNNANSLQTTINTTKLNLPTGIYRFNATMSNATYTNITDTRTFTLYQFLQNGINSPTNGSIFSNQIINISWNATTTNPNITTSITYNLTLLNKDFTINRTINTSTIDTNFQWNITNANLQTGTYIINITTNNLVSQTRHIHYINPTSIYESSVVEGESSEFYLNLSLSNLETNINLSGSLIYNNTNYSSSAIVSGNNYFLYNNITIDSISNSMTKYFYWNYTINGQNLQTQIYNQTIIFLNPLILTNASCSPYATAIFFDIKDEENLTGLFETIQYNLYFGLSNGTFKNIFGTISNVQNFSLCLNASIDPNWTLGSGSIFYTKEGYVDRRYYFFEGSRITNNTVNVTLYSLLSNLQTSFQLVVESNSLSPYTNKFTTLVRWYPNLNSYNVVDMGLTDETGSTVIHVKPEDVDYRIGVYEQDGTLIYLADPIRMVCLTTPCTYTLKISPSESDYTSFLGIDYDLDFNYTTNLWRFTFSDTTQRTSSMNLTVYKDTGTTTIQACTSTVTGYNGAITCNTSGYAGTLRAVVQRSASPPIPIATKIIETATSSFKSDYGLFITLIIAVPIVFIFAILSPVLGIIGVILSLIPAWYFGTISTLIITSFAVLGGIAIHFMRKGGVR